MIDSLLVANRGEIARRIIRTARGLGVRTVAVHSPVDKDLPFVGEADQAYELVSGTTAGYGDADAVLAALRESGAQAVHPGYGFLSENADFAAAVLRAGCGWVGPEPETIAAMGDKIEARARVAAAGVPVLPSSPGAVRSLDEVDEAAESVGFPLMMKASAGGGGMGMVVAHDRAAAARAYQSLIDKTMRLFGDDRIFVERYLPSARHVEVQILGLADGRVIALGDRDCSVQRRNQKLLEEAPAPGLDGTLRAALAEAAVAAGESVHYRNAGTVEFLVDPRTGEFFFLEMNTRLQVEHPVTEAVFGVDLVAAQLRIASGEPVGFALDGLRSRGHAIEMRVNAEDARRFLPSPGDITAWEEPAGEGIRVDAGYGKGDAVTAQYDSLLAKLIVHAGDREAAIALAREAVAAFVVSGPKTTLPFHLELLDDPEFRSGDYDTGIISRMRERAG
ncbi:biotin carboxylase N-terminal domain-containing protein [Nonomuraea sp. B5E05]|uniref:acetyl-CoA carboxylase biotin carboxylase subunit n=1 Tax=Nonomuraea sp. B5E05 TaxID=3153569 RepID=UPI003261116D